MRRLPTPFPLCLSLSLLLPLAGCLGGAAEEALKNNLQGVADTITIDGETIVANCLNKTVVKVDRAKIEPDAPGGASPEGIARVAQEIQAGCEAPAIEAKQEEREQKRFADECKKQRVKKCKGTVAEMQKALCAKLSKGLALRGERRDRDITSNAKNWGCPDPGPPKLGPRGYWEVESQGRGKKRTVSIRLDSDPDEEGRFARMTLKCKGKKVDMYLAETFALRKTKKLSGTVDGKKVTWKVAMSTDRKAVFIKDIKGAVGGMKRGKDLVLKLRDGKKKTVERKFPIGGIASAVKKLGRSCRL